MKNKGGRKGYGEELRIKQRFSALTEPYFHALQGFLESEEKADRKFAISELTKAYSRMIPTEVTGEGGKAIVIHVAKEIAETEDLYDTPLDTSTDSEGSS